ncbi:hypothetical protein HMPREF1988_01681 [Porphyromonas gingivalis F0185]|nr:hypothetical protein HMPREF1988_01681 [Porphyromonas gingivalis F0185]
MSAKQFETGISKKKERIMLLYFIALFFLETRETAGQPDGLLLRLSCR